jgi:hypothetical protein
MNGSLRTCIACFGASILWAASPGCASSTGAGSETHFACARDMDCGADASCIGGRCVSKGGGTPHDAGATDAPPSTVESGSPRDSGVTDAPPSTVESGSPRDSGVTDARPGTVESGSSLPGTCPTSGAVVAPLDDGCTDDVCHLVLRLDYRTLGLLGWASTGGSLQFPDASKAGAIAQDVITANCMYCTGDVGVSIANAGLYRAFVQPGDSGAFALVGAHSGAVVAAGGVAWAGRGSYFVPSTWKSASEIQCGTAAATPAETFIDATGCDLLGGSGAGADPRDALALALRTNLAQVYAQKGPFSAYTYLYTPAVGGCDPAVAEYVVVLTH